jgi:murein DD-endopeptidase MepM/ murein hydrolase activator NlpD
VLRRVPARARRLHLLVVLAVGAALLPGAAASAQQGPIDVVVDLTFPVHDPQGLTTYTDDYHHARSGGRTHMATDIGGPNAYGVRIHAAVGGTITWLTGMDGTAYGASAGYAIGIRGDDGHTYRYMHLGGGDRPIDEAYAPGIRRGVRVERGQHLGYLGYSGNASPSWPHLHFEICRAHDCTDRLNPFHSLRDAERRGDYPGNGVARTAGSGFADVASTHPHAAGITFVDVAEISQGCTVDRFCPDRAVTRGQMATFLHKALGLADAGAPPFDDVPANHPHAAGIAAVAAAGISEGRGNGRFDPQSPVRRDQMATFLRNGLGLPTSTTSYPDVHPSSPHATAIGAIADAGITRGFPDGTYKPMGDVSRAQMATFLKRALD